MTKEDRIEAYKSFMPIIYTNPVLLGKLDRVGFFTAPASAKFHGSHEGGLFDHSYEVAKELVRMTNRLGLIWEDERSPYIVGMFHDFCKVGQYERVGTEANNFTYVSPLLIPGHGERSVIELSRLIRLNDEEIACIRWHMGAFEGESMYKSYTLAVRLYKNVLYTHTADMYASHVLGV